MQAFDIMGLSKREIIASANKRGGIKAVSYWANKKGIPQMISIEFTDGEYVRGCFNRRTRRIDTV